MKSIQSYSFEPKYKRNNGLLVIDTDSLPLPDDFKLQETSLVRLPAGEVAGNHKHPRQEAYFSLDKNVELHWIDEAGHTHTEVMSESDDKPHLFVIPPHVPHAVINKSQGNAALLGYADGPLTAVETVEVIVPNAGHKEGLTESEIAQATQLLSKLKPGFLPFDIFHEVTRIAATPIVEVVPLRKSTTGGIEILLLEREADDPVWPGQMHVPGAVVRASDTPGSFADALKRVLSKELADAKTSDPTFVKNILHHSGRGMEASQIFWVEIEGDVTTGAFYDATSLPVSVVKSQLDFIPDAIVHFKKSVS